MISIHWFWLAVLCWCFFYLGMRFVCHFTDWYAKHHPDEFDAAYRKIREGNSKR